METFKWPSLESSRGAESTSPDCVAGPDFTCQMQRKLKLFSPLASRTSNAFRFFCFPMHFIFGLNQMVPCFAELIMCLRASPSQLAEGRRNGIVAGSIVGSTKTLPHYCPFLVKSATGIAKKPIGPCIEVHDVKLNTSIVGRWLCIWEKSWSSSGILIVLPTLIVTMANIRSRNCWKEGEKKFRGGETTLKECAFMSLKIQLLEMAKTLKLSCSYNNNRHVGCGECLARSLKTRRGFPIFVIITRVFLHWMRVMFIVRMLLRSFGIVQVQATQDCILCDYSLLVTLQRYTLMGKNKKGKSKNYAFEEAWIFVCNRCRQW